MLVQRVPAAVADSQFAAKQIAAACADAKDAKTPAESVNGARSAARRLGLTRGLKPTRVTIPYSFNLTCGVTGVINGGVAISPDTNALEWAAFQALYDEYKVHGGVVKFALGYQTKVPTASGGLNIDNLGFVLAYDPTDPNSLTSVREGTELAQHIMLIASPIQGAGTAATTFGFRSANSKPFVLSWSTKKVANLSIQTGAVSYSPGVWKAIQTAGSNNPDGQLKPYGTCDLTAVAVCCTGIHYLDVEFRSRK